MGLDITSTVQLANGVRMPLLGLGTYKMVDDTEVERSVCAALEAEYRSVDTASMYENEAAVGRAIRSSGVPRDEVFIATKAWNDEQGEAGIRRAIERSLTRLGVESVDLYLVHWPILRLYASTWRGMERVLSDGLTRAIGVCNFLVGHLEGLREATGASPLVNQVEHHPWLPQPELRAYCREHGIVLEAWAPLMRGRLGEAAGITAIAARHEVTPEQVALRWALQREVVVIPKSTHPGRIRANADLYRFDLSDAEMAAIDALDRGEAGRLGKHPDDFVDR